MKYEIRDLRRKQFFMVDDEYLNGYARHLGPTASCVYFALCRHADKQQACFPSQKTMATKLGIGEKTVKRAIKKLLSWNIIQVKRVRREDGQFLRNTYYLVDKQYWEVPEVNVTHGPKGHTCPDPGVNNVHHHGSSRPPKGTHGKETHIRARDENKINSIKSQLRSKYGKGKL